MIMELQDIQEKINNLLAGTERKIVFWYDDDASYADDIDALQLEDGCKVLKLTGKNNFAAKLLLEKQGTETSYLVYAPFARPHNVSGANEHFVKQEWFLIRMMTI